MKTNHIFSLFVLISNYQITFSQVTLIPATGGTNLNTSTYTTLGDIIIYENAPGDFPGAWNDGGDLILLAPNGFEFEDPNNYWTLGYIKSFIKGSNFFDIFLNNITPTEISLGIEYSATPNALGDTLILPGIRVKASSPSATTGNIVRKPTSYAIGDAVINGIIMGVTNFGTLSTASSGTSEHEQSNQVAKISPNPFSEYTIISINPTMISGNIELKLYDVLGNLICGRNTSETNIIFEKNTFPSSGLYFYNIIQDNKIIDRGKMVLE